MDYKINKHVNTKKNSISSIYILAFSLLFLIICTSCSKETHEGEAQAPLESSSASGKNYEDVVKRFETAGFKAVSTRKIPDLITGWLTKDGEVESVSINGDTDYSTSDWFAQDVSVVVAYHTFPSKDDKADNTTSDDNLEKSEEKTTAETTTEAKKKEPKTTETKTTEAKTTEEETTAEITTEAKSSEPIIVDGSNIGSIKVGDYISATGPAHILCTSDGIIKVGGNDSGNYAHCGMELLVDNPNSSYNSYTIQAYKVKPGDYEDTFYSHTPNDFSTEPSTVGDRSYSGCRATITGRVDKILISEELENFYGLSLGANSVVEYLELYY